MKDEPHLFEIRTWTHGGHEQVSLARTLTPTPATARMFLRRSFGPSISQALQRHEQEEGERWKEAHMLGAPARLPRCDVRIFSGHADS